jgi:hypothetical protein
MAKYTSGSASRIKKPRKAVKTSEESAIVSPAIVPDSPVVAAPAPIEAAAPVSASAPVEVSAAVTTIVAKVDVGFGNTLFLRGTGPGLSWEVGVEMTNTGSDEWTWMTTKASADFLAKVLINDVIWSGDPDTAIKAGEKTVIKATF